MIAVYCRLTSADSFPLVAVTFLDLAVSDLMRNSKNRIIGGNMKKFGKIQTLAIALLLGGSLASGTVVQAQTWAGQDRQQRLRIDRTIDRIDARLNAGVTGISTATTAVHSSCDRRR
jgi:hypothetical protein